MEMAEAVMALAMVVAEQVEVEKAPAGMVWGAVAAWVTEMLVLVDAALEGAAARALEMGKVVDEKAVAA